jgi:hypothetical protein
MSNPEFKKTILIGLGGVGQQILLNVKRLLMDTYGAVPPSVKMLSLDTDLPENAMQSAHSEQMYSFGPDEFLHLTISDPKGFIEGSESVRKWYVLPMPVGAITNGAGAVRQNGRLALFFHIAEVLRRIDTMNSTLADDRLQQRMANAKSELGSSKNFSLSQKPTEVIVCGSLAGGTGSGTFLDMGILLRDSIPNALINGYFMLYWPFRDKAFANRIKGNMYAALSELENIQSIMYGNKDFTPYHVKYGDKTITVDKAPYNLCHLIDGRKEHGEVINEVQDINEAIGNGIFLGMSSMIYKVNSVTDNLLSHINVASPTLWDGHYARYSSIGVGSIYYPARELHGWVSSGSAVNLCNLALNEVRGGDAEAQERRQQEIELDFKRFCESHGLRRELVPGRLCEQIPIEFEMERGDCADTEMLQSRLENVEQSLTVDLTKSFEAKGKPFLENVLLTLDSKFKDFSNIENGTSKDSAYREAWIDYAIGAVQALIDQTTTDMNNTEQKIINFRTDATNRMELATKARYIPIIGGPRKNRVEEWQQTAISLLGAVAMRKRFEFEKKFYIALVNHAEKLRPEHVPTLNEYESLLTSVLRILEKKHSQEESYLQRIEKKSAQIVVGAGKVILTSKEDSGLRSADSFKLSYDAFKKASNINSSEDYLKFSKGDPTRLAALFAGYAGEAWKDIKQFGVQDVLEWIAKDNGRKEIENKKNRGIVLSALEEEQIIKDETYKYLSEQIGHLFRISSALWSYNRGRLSEIQSLNYDHIINVGVPEQKAGEAIYNNIVRGAREKYGYRADHSFSGTGDQKRIWLLNYAAALPVYFLADLPDIKEKYEEEIVPTYHIDKYLEMNVPDLFPISDSANTALRILAMAIVQGIDVIRDTYPKDGERGHEFTCDSDSVKKVNSGSAATWKLFRTMYTDVANSKELREALLKNLKEKVTSMQLTNPDGLKDCIKAHISKIKQKLDTRDFSRLVSARLTYREIKCLDTFIKPTHENGYNMDINKYLAMRG